MRLLLAVLLLARAAGEAPDPDVGRFGYDCENAFSTWRSDWNTDKQHWCCEYVKRGCVNEATTYDCNDGRDMWKAAWSGDKKDWCCQHHQVGCPWKCDVEEDQWSSQEHREWCCKHHPPAGCTLHIDAPRHKEEVAHKRVHFNCRAHLDMWERDWTEEKKSWCCEHDYPRGCAYACDIGMDDWRTRWSVHKKAFCCKKQPPLGCKAQEPYNCSAGLANSELGWSDEKKAYCCQHHPPSGCEVEPFDCLHGLGNWRGSWTDSKKQWCCANKPPTGCETRPDPFDCVESQRHQWSNAEQRWCCRHAKTKLGCKKHDHYCSVHFQSRTWSHHHICYCCKHHGIACPPVYYPPDVPENAVICEHIPDSDLAMFEVPRSKTLLISQVPEARAWRRTVLVAPAAAVLSLLPLVGWVVLRRRGAGRQAYLSHELDDHRDSLALDRGDKEIAECS